MRVDGSNAGGGQCGSSGNDAAQSVSTPTPLRVGSRLRASLLTVGAAVPVVAVVLIFVLSAAGGAQATQAPSAAQLLHTALSDANARGSVHEVESEKSSKVSGTLSADVSTHEGRQDITHSGGEQAHVLVVGGTAYFSGNQAALIHYFGLPAAVALKVGTRWVSVPSSSSGYSVVAAGTTLSSALGSFAIPGHLTQTAPTKVDGQPVVGIHGKGSIGGSASASLSVTVYVSRTSTPLPVRASYTYSTGGSVTLDLSGWGERLALHAPSNVIPTAQL